MIVSLNDLVSIASPASILSIELQLAQQLGLPTTAWQPLSMVRTTMAVTSNLYAQGSSLINLAAQGGYASYAALMVDVNGQPITTWMDLIASNNYNVVRVPITFASGPVPVNNGSSSPQAYGIGQLRFQNPTTGATYANTIAGTLLANTSNQQVQVQADQAFGGTIGTSGAGVVLILITPLPGITVSALAASLVGQNAETNAALLLRSQNKLGTLSVLGQLSSTNTPPNPAGPRSAYAFVATSIPQASVANAAWPYTVTVPITRISLQIAAGVVVAYIANAAGAPSVADTLAVNAALQFLVEPDGVTVVTIAAQNFPVNIAYTVYVRSGGTLTPTQIQNNISTALALYFASVPIGGITTSTSNIVPINEVVQTIMNANGGTLDVSLTANGGTGNLAVAQPFYVPVLGTLTGIVVNV